MSAEAAAAGLARLAADDFAAVPPDSLWTATLYLAAEVAHRLEDVATARGLPRLAEFAEAFLAAAGPPRIGGPGGRLSPREVEVLRLLAGGVSNAGIAA